MANSKSAYLRQKTLLKTLKNQDYTVATVYIGLTVGGVEPIGNGYARIGPPSVGDISEIDGAC